MRHLKPIFENVSATELRSWINIVIQDEEEIRGICNGILDLCSEKNFLKVAVDDWSLERIYTLGKGDLQGYGLILRFNNNGLSSTIQKLTDEYIKVLDELIEVRNRLDELGYFVFIQHKDYGMSVGIYYKKIVELVNAKKAGR